MKKMLMAVTAALLFAVPAHAALEGGDVLVLDTNVNPIYSLIPLPITPTPLASRLFNVKPDGTVETLKEFGPYEDVRTVAVAPDGSVIAVRAGNYVGGPTPTPVGSATPYPAGAWRESAVYRIQPDGSSAIIAEGGLLNPPLNLPAAYFTYILPVTLLGSAVDAQGNIYLSHGLMGVIPPLPGTPTPHPAVLKLSPDGSTLTEFAYGPELGGSTGSPQYMGNPLAIDADGNLYLALQCSVIPTSTPTPLPGTIVKINPQGTPSIYAVATPVGDPNDDISQPFSNVSGFGFDQDGTLLIGGIYEDDFAPSGTHSTVQSVSSAGVFTPVFDAGLGPENAFCVDGEGGLLGANPASNSVYEMIPGASPQVDFIASGAPLGYIRYLQYYPPATPPFETWFSEALLAEGEGVAVGFDIARGRTDNTADLYFGIQFPAGAGGGIQLFNPNASTNGFPLLIPLELAQQFPSEVPKLRYGNGTTTVRGSGSVELGSFPSVSGIPAGTYLFLGVITEPGASLFDTSKWRTPGGQPVSDECVFIGTL